MTESEYQVFKEAVSSIVSVFGIDEFMIVATKKNGENKDVFHYSNAEFNKNTIVSNISTAAAKILIFADGLNKNKK